MSSAETRWRSGKRSRHFVTEDCRSIQDRVVSLVKTLLGVAKFSSVNGRLRYPTHAVGVNDRRRGPSTTAPFHWQFSLKHLTMLFECCISPTHRASLSTGVRTVRLPVAGFAPHASLHATLPTQSLFCATLHCLEDFAFVPDHYVAQAALRQCISLSFPSWRMIFSS